MVDQEEMLKMTLRYLGWVTKYLLMLMIRIRKAEGEAATLSHPYLAAKNWTQGAQEGSLDEGCGFWSPESSLGI